MGSTIQAEGGCNKYVSNRIRAGWNRWREMSCVICDKKVPEVLKNKIYRTAIRPAMTLWWGMLGDENMRAKPDEHIINVDAEMDTRKTRKYHIRNVTIREKAHRKPINTFLMKKRLSRFGHGQRRCQHLV